MTRRLRVAFLLLGVAVLVVLVRGADVQTLLGAMAAARWPTLAVAGGLLVANLLVKALRWQVMTAQLSRERLRFFPAVAAIAAGVAAGSLTPGRGVELAKPLLLRRSHGVGLASSTAAVVAERMLDGTAIAVLFAGALAFLPAARGTQFYPAAIAVALFIAAAALVAVTPTRLGAVAVRAVRRLPLAAGARERAASAVETFFRSLLLWRRREQLWLVLALSVLAALLDAARLVLVCAAMRTPIAMSEAMLTVSVATFIGVISLIPGGIGITEFTMAGIVRLATANRYAPAAVTAAVLVDRALSYYLIVLAGSAVLLTAAWGRRGRV